MNEFWTVYTINSKGIFHVIDLIDGELIWDSIEHANVGYISLDKCYRFTKAEATTLKLFLSFKDADEHFGIKKL